MKKAQQGASTQEQPVSGHAEIESRGKRKTVEDSGLKSELVAGKRPRHLVWLGQQVPAVAFRGDSAHVDPHDAYGTDRDQ